MMEELLKWLYFNRNATELFRRHIHGECQSSSDSLLNVSIDQVKLLEENRLAYCRLLFQILLFEFMLTMVFSANKST